MRRIKPTLVIIDEPSPPPCREVVEGPFEFRGYRSLILSGVPDPEVRDRLWFNVLNNLTKGPPDNYKLKHDEIVHASSVLTVIRLGFPWVLSPEGRGYWVSVAKHLRGISCSPNFPSTTAPLPPIRI